MFDGISSLLIIENLQSSQIPSGLSVSFTLHILHIIYFSHNTNQWISHDVVNSSSLL